MSKSDCPLCAESINQQALIQACLDSKEDGQIRWLAIKRNYVEAPEPGGLGIEEATVSGLKHHITQHLEVAG